MSRLTDNEGGRALHPTFSRADFAVRRYLQNEREATKWIEAVTGEKLGGNFHQSLANGVILCNLANKIWPNSIPIFDKETDYVYKAMDNVSKFLVVVKEKGLSPNLLFQADDLVEKKGMEAVVECIRKVAEMAKKQGFPISWKSEGEVEFSRSELQYARGLGLNLWGPAPVSEKKAATRKVAHDTIRKKKEQIQKAVTQKSTSTNESVLAREKSHKDEESDMQKKYGKEGYAQICKDIGELERLQKVDNEYNSLLHLAAELGKFQALKYLIIDKKMNPNVTNKALDTPLHYASRSNDENAVDLLLTNGAELNAMNRDGSYPIHYAAEKGGEKVINKLMNAGADLNAQNLFLDTPLTIAARKGNNSAVATLLTSKNIDVNAANKSEETALHLAAVNGHAPVVKTLGRHPTLNLNARDQHEATPLHKAVENGFTDVVESLVEAGVDIQAKRDDGWSPLYTAAYNGDIRVVHLLCKKGADVNATNLEGWVPLHASCAQGHIEVCEALVVTYKANINILNEQGTTPLFHAVAAGKRSIATLLLDKGGDINYSKPGGWKPIHVSAYNAFEKLTRFLVERGAQIDAVCQEIKNYTPLHILISSEEPPLGLIQFLVTSGANVNAKNSNGKTPLHLACFWGHLGTVKYLVEHGANVNAVTDKGRTPLEIAALYGRENIAQYLAAKLGVATPALSEKTRNIEMMKQPFRPPAPDSKKE